MGAIERSKENDAWQLLTGFGIPNVGKAAAKAILKVFPDLMSLRQADVEELTVVNDIGEVSAGCIRDFFADEKNQQMFQRLMESGVNMTSRQQPQEGPFSGMTFVITGTLPNLDRKEAASLVEANGGKVSGSVSKKTSYVLAGERGGSKLTKAAELGIAVINENQFMQLLNQ